MGGSGHGGPDCGPCSSRAGAPRHPRDAIPVPIPVPVPTEETHSQLLILLSPLGRGYAPPKFGYHITGRSRSALEAVPKM